MSEATARFERRVLVAVDEGEESMYALSWSLRNVIFQNSRDTLILLYVKPPHAVYSPLDSTGRIDDPETPGYLFSPDISAAIEKYSQEVADCVLEKAKKLCKDLQNVCCSFVPLDLFCFDDKVMVETRVESGDPRDVICDMSQKLGADLLIMGSHGYGVVKRAFLGSVSNYCSQNVKCPVLIVKKPKPSAGAGK
ncbi:Universal stress protein A-like protein [Glycine max]|nr:Universal stress protein A-like protein [Glycine max]